MEPKNPIEVKNEVRSLFFVPVRGGISTTQEAMLLYIHNDASELWVTVLEKAMAGTNMPVRNGGITGSHYKFPG